MKCFIISYSLFLPHSFLFPVFHIRDGPMEAGKEGKDEAGKTIHKPFMSYIIQEKRPARLEHDKFKRLLGTQFDALLFEFLRGKRGIPIGAVDVASKRWGRVMYQMACELLHFSIHLQLLMNAFLRKSGFSPLEEADDIVGILAPFSEPSPEKIVFSGYRKGTCGRFCFDYFSDFTFQLFGDNLIRVKLQDPVSACSLDGHLFVGMKHRQIFGLDDLCTQTAGNFSCLIR